MTLQVQNRLLYENITHLFFLRKACIQKRQKASNNEIDSPVDVINTSKTLHLKFNLGTQHNGLRIFNLFIVVDTLSWLSIDTPTCQHLQQH